MKKQHRSILSCLLVFALVCSMVAVPEYAAAKAIKLKNCNQIKSMPVGSTFLLRTNQKAANLSFSSGKKKVASVTDGGLITAKKKGTAMITITSGKSKKKVKVVVKNPTGYSITKKAGSYKKAVVTKVTAKKGYTVYYTLSEKFKKSWCIKAKKAKTFTFSKTTTLKLYPVKASVKMTTAKLNQTEAKDKNRGDYLYQIEADTGVAPTATAASGAVAGTVAPSGTVNPATIAPPSAEGPDITSPTETTAPVVTAEVTESPVYSTAPGGASTGDGSLSDYVAPVEADYDKTDTEAGVPADAVQITIPSVAPSSKVIEDVYEISKKNKLTLTSAGTFVVKTEGTEEVDATVAIDKSVRGTVRLILDGVRLKTNAKIDPTDYDDAGVLQFTNKNDDDTRRIVVTVREGSVNTITNTGVAATDASDGSVYYPVGIYCKKQPLTINGSGSLQITCENGVGIKVSKLLKKEDGTKVATGILKILDVHMEIGGGEGRSTAHNGITAKHGVFVKNADLEILSDGDGLKTSLDEKDAAEDTSLAKMGNMTIEGGRISITSFAGDAVSAYRTLKLSPEYLEAITKNQDLSGGSRKAIKAGRTIYIPSEAGTIIADTTATYSQERQTKDANDPYADDTIHCDGCILIEGGDLQLSAGDDGIYAAYGLTVNEGTILVKESYEGLEAMTIIVNGGSVTVHSRDDGFNAGGGNNSNSAAASSAQLIINDGIVYIDAEGDGMDSDGDIFFKGGTVTIDGPTNGGNGALDYGDINGICEISGGTLIAAGARGMDDAPTSGSTQPVVNVVLTAPQAAGTYVVIKDTENNVVMTAQPAKMFQSVIMSCEQWKLGETYTVYTGASLDVVAETVSFTFTAVSMTTGNSNTGGWIPGGFRQGDTVGGQPGGRKGCDMEV